MELDKKWRQIGRRFSVWVLWVRKFLPRKGEESMNVRSFLEGKVSKALPWEPIVRRGVIVLSSTRRCAHWRKCGTQGFPVRGLCRILPDFTLSCREIYASLAITIISTRFNKAPLFKCLQLAKIVRPANSFFDNRQVVSTPKVFGNAKNICRNGEKNTCNRNRFCGTESSSTPIKSFINYNNFKLWHKISS